MHPDVAFAAQDAESDRAAYLAAVGTLCPCGAYHDEAGELCADCASEAAASDFAAALQQVEAERLWVVVAFALRCGPVCVGVALEVA